MELDPEEFEQLFLYALATILSDQDPFKEIKNDNK